MRSVASRTRKWKACCSALPAAASADCHNSYVTSSDTTRTTPVNQSRVLNTPRSCNTRLSMYFMPWPHTYRFRLHAAEKHDAGRQQSSTLGWLPKKLRQESGSRVFGSAKDCRAVKEIGPVFRPGRNACHCERSGNLDRLSNWMRLSKAV